MHIHPLNQWLICKAVIQICHETILLLHTVSYSYCVILIPSLANPSVWTRSVMYCTSISTTCECMSIPETVDVSISVTLVTRCARRSGNGGVESQQVEGEKELVDWVDWGRNPSRRVGGLDDFLKQFLDPKKLVGKSALTKWDES